jgi:hypothetical protein
MTRKILSYKGFLLGSINKTNKILYIDQSLKRYIIK